MPHSHVRAHTQRECGYGIKGVLIIECNLPMPVTNSSGTSHVPRVRSVTLVKWSRLTDRCSMMHDVVFNCVDKVDRALFSEACRDAICNSPYPESLYPESPNPNPRI